MGSIKSSQQNIYFFVDTKLTFGIFILIDKMSKILILN